MFNINKMFDYEGDLNFRINTIVDPDDFVELFNKYGFITCHEIFRIYGISKQKTYRAIRSGYLLAFMLGPVGSFVVRWHIIKNEYYDKFINENRIDLYGTGATMQAKERLEQMKREDLQKSSQD